MSCNRSLRAGLAALVLVAVACGGGEDSETAAACTPAGGTLAADATAEGLAGHYALTLAATTPAETLAVGTLDLVAQDGDLQSVMGPDGTVDPLTTMPLIGTAEIGVEDVGAVRLGDLASADPQRPGVVVLHRAGSITLRLGADGNERGMVRYDGGYLALSVSEMSAEGFKGTWASGVTRRDAAGHFCAVRLDR